MAAEVADAERGRIDEAHVLDFELLLEIVGGAAIIGPYVAAAIGLSFTCGDQGLAVRGEPLIAGKPIQLVRDALEHFGGHIPHVLDHMDSAAWRRGQFFTQGSSPESRL
ncbi:hypothetical protein X759_30470 [Mesorhizobium sp. LSHC420B00]|nr:hypothetical protein X759_30470 [Mesorhizobium sp. LSHC420B00]